MASQLPPLIQSLRNPSAYPDHPDSVEFIQTHISYVFLAGEHVYKLKKPVDFGFLDYTTPELRRHSCENEVRLNRRLSPDVYLGVVPIVQVNGHARAGGPGEPLDWAVQMRRLPADRMLETLIADRAVPEGTGRRLGEAIGRFHLNAEQSARITQIGGRAAVAGNWRENFEQARRFRGRTISAEDDDRIQAYVSEFLEREAGLLAERDDGGFIRDLHGDLRTAQIWILDQPDGIRILDCIEFNERLRFCDTASDLAFLAADLVYRRRADLGLEMISRYLEVTNDSHLPLLLNFYSCYRAYVRGKVDSLGLTEREINATQRRRLARRARGFFRLAARHTVAPSSPRLIAMMGISGSGKSFLARRLAIRLGATLLSTDVIRKQIVGIPAHHAAGPAAYTRQISARTYAALIEEAEIELLSGHSVVLDATFLTRSSRRPAATLAVRLQLPFVLVWCQARRGLLERRLRDRQADAFHVSDADLAIAQRQSDHEEPPNELPPSSVIRAATGGDTTRLLRRLMRQLA